MADLARLFDFTAGQPVKSSEVDSELNQLVAGHNAQEDALEILGTYRRLERVAAFLSSTVVISSGDWFADAVGGVAKETVDGAQGIAAFYLAAADYAITGKTSKLRVRAQCLTNGIAPGVTLTAGLFPVSSVAGASGLLQATLGAVVAGSTVAFVTPSANARNQGNSGDFTPPADDFYVLGVTVSGGLAGGARVALAVQLQQRHV